MEGTQAQSRAPEEQVRAAIRLGLEAEGVEITEDVPGSLDGRFGSVGKAYLAGGLRARSKMPVRIRVLTQGGEGGTGIAVTVEGRGGGGGVSGGLLGASKQRKTNREWLERVVAAIPERVRPTGPPPG